VPLPPTRTTRLAPTPSGALHIGNARTFIATWALARHEDWRIILRLEDLDLGRVKPGAHEAALEDIRWLKLDWDGAPEVQSHDSIPYRQALAALAAQGSTFPCDRSRAEIRSAASAPHAEDGETRFPPELRAPTPWATSIESWHTNHRLLVEPAPETVLDELLGEHVFNPGLEAGDFVLWTKLGVPAYQLAVVVDDARHGVTDVVRGDDLLASAARQQIIARRLGCVHARWWHLPLVYDTDGKRLAKRHGAHSLASLRERRVKPERVIGWCAWSLGLLPALEPIESRDLVALTSPGALRAAAQRTRERPTVFMPSDLDWIHQA
jgi:glutamyl-tRNA synthetase